MPRFPFSCVFLVLLLCVVPAFGASDVPASVETCLMCHDDVVNAEEFTASVHGPNGCVSCHVDLVDEEAHMEGELMPEPAECVRCHKEETAQHYASVHQLNGIDCIDCHSDIHAITDWQENKSVVSAKCGECHDYILEEYEVSAHGRAVEAGNQDSPSCADCHNLHLIRGADDLEHPRSHDFHTDVCLQCHADEEMMKRNDVLTVAVDTYLNSYHGKNYMLGYPEEVAGCADCHASHAVMAAENPESSIHPDNLINTCGQCHPGASAQFVKFHAHGDMTNRAEYPILYYTYVGMTTLLVSTFAVFWVHTLLWMFRGFVENREKRRLLAAGLGHVIPEAHRIYRRFNPFHIFLHVLVIVSFLLLSLTGIPLKFAGQEWAPLLMRFFGGAENAAFLHRVGVVITFFYFFSALVMSAKFLFSGLRSPAEFLERLFGPESLFPNMRDVRDVTAMFRWFFFIGPKPSFERWTYWEKFDFFAVFWGMFVIGGSGVMLWFPEYFATVLPGWSLNVATIVHSDEALLATGFIFTIHFFNTHMRPEKFPMDFVIFNGEITKEEFIEERADQWKRYEDAGILESYVKEKPSGVAYDFFFKGFGFIALFIGIILLLLMFYAFIAGGQHL